MKKIKKSTLIRLFCENPLLVLEKSNLKMISFLTFSVDLSLLKYILKSSVLDMQKEKKE